MMHIRSVHDIRELRESNHFHHFMDSMDILHIHHVLHVHIIACMSSVYFIRGITPSIGGLLHCLPRLRLAASAHRSDRAVFCCLCEERSDEAISWHYTFDRGIASLPATPSARSFGSPQ